MRVLALSRYGPQGASSRLRIHQFNASLRACGIDLETAPLVTDEMLLHRYSQGTYSKSGLVTRYALRILRLLRAQSFDALLIEAEAVPWCPLWIEALLLAGRRIVVDYDDAVFHRYDMHASRAVRLALGTKIGGVMRKADLVLAGNGYIATHAVRSGARRVEVLPTVVDLSRYPPPLIRRPSSDQPVRVVWIGQPTNFYYLSALMSAIRAVSARRPITLRVIGASLPPIQGVDIEYSPWSEDTEVQLLSQSDIGIMPLPDTPWARGKCGYKLIQYMACGLPVLASPVGVNREIVLDGVNGFCCHDDSDWVERLDLLACDAALRQQLGAAGRALVEEQFSIDKVALRFAALLKSVVACH